MRQKIMNTKITNEQKLDVQHSLVPLFLGIIPMELIAVLLLIFPFSFLVDKQTPLLSIITTIFIGIFILINIYIAVTVYNWINSYYVITKDSVLYNEKRLFKTKRNFYTLNENADLKLRENFIGKIFNYGTIDIVGPTIEEKISLIKIRKPEHVMRKLVDLVSKIESGDVFVT